jgi:putative copper resistance protein D
VAAAVEPLSFTTLATRPVLDPTAVLLCVAATAGYLVGTRRLARRGRPWPRPRTAAFLAGVAALATATLSGLARYDTVLFSAHVAQHVLLGIVAPLLLALSAPVTLALQAADRRNQVNLLRALHSRPARVLGHPVLAWFVFGATLFALYFSPLYELSLRNGVVHAWVHVHFVVAGSLFAWATIGLDPVPHRLGHPARLLLVVLTVPFHAVLGVALLSAAEPLAGGFYSGVARPPGSSPLADQRVGAAVMWLVGDVVSLVLTIVVARQWWATEQRRTRHLDARLDAAEVVPGITDGSVSPPPVPR